MSLNSFSIFQFVWNFLKDLKTEERTKIKVQIECRFFAENRKEFFLNFPVDLQSLYIRMLDHAILTEMRN